MELGEPASHDCAQKTPPAIGNAEMELLGAVFEGQTEIVSRLVKAGAAVDVHAIQIIGRP